MKVDVHVRKEGAWYVATDRLTQVSDRAKTRDQAVRNLKKALRARHETRERALQLFAAGTVTLSRAAELAKTPVWEMMTLARERRIIWIDDEVIEEVRREAERK